MIGRRITAGVLLSCALVLSALTAPSASALGTTAFACITEAGKAGSKGFSDEHCTNTAEGTAVKYVHHEVQVVGKEDEATLFEASNEKTAESTKKSTNTVLKSTVGGVELEIVCTKMTSEGRVWNHEIEEVMQTTGIATFAYEGCTVPKPTNKEGKAQCKVKTPMTSKIPWTTSETLGFEANEMGLVFNPSEGEKIPFLEITFQENEINKCPFTLEKPTSVEGQAIGTPNGATLSFNAAESGNTLSFLGNAVSFSAAQTMRMKKVLDENEVVTPGAPLAFTTTSK